MDGSVAEIITQFAEYLSLIFKMIKEFIANFTKKEEGTTEAAEEAEE